MRVCHFCHRIIDGEVYQKITGWVVTGKRDHLTLREDVSPAEFAHRSCIRQRQSGVSVGQESLIS